VGVVERIGRTASQIGRRTEGYALQSNYKPRGRHLKGRRGPKSLAKKARKERGYGTIGGGGGKKNSVLEQRRGDDQAHQVSKQKQNNGGIFQSI